jgi:DNA-binding NarL/FixJ family response regulator
MKVFLVEDSPLLRDRLQTLLAAIPGARTVGHAESAREAIEQIVAAAPDVVVLDLSLREGNGFDVLRALKGRPIDCYILTNHPIEGFRSVAMRLGARGFFDKSSEFQKLKDILAARAAA